MILDGHIHISAPFSKDDHLVDRLKMANIDGGIIISLPPSTYRSMGKTYSPNERIEDVLLWAQLSPNLYPFYWIDPTEDDAMDQVDLAVEKGIKGFKVICSHFFPGEDKAMKAYERIASYGKPILFHSGILYDGGRSSSRYNRPVEFEALFDINGLRFALAHVSWPWCDECIAVYGKFDNARKRQSNFKTEMFIDITPGTPKIYREEVLKKLFTVGYDIADNVFFGTDCRANDYRYEYAKEIIERDNSIYEKLNLPDEIYEKIYEKNLKRFIGILI